MNDEDAKRLGYHDKRSLEINMNRALHGSDKPMFEVGEIILFNVSPPDFNHVKARVISRERNNLTPTTRYKYKCVMLEDTKTKKGKPTRCKAGAICVFYNDTLIARKYIPDKLPSDF